MKNAAFLAGVFLLWPHALLADHIPCIEKDCRQVFYLSSVSDAQSYGVLLAAPEEGCTRVRFRVETLARVFLGHTPALAPGELSIVRIGQGFAAGETILTITAEGCTTPPAVVRRVTLAKRSPDHGARSAAFGS
jgi:hypothetical protein